MANKAKAKEPEILRKLRIAESANGATLRPRVIPNKKHYNRKTLKSSKSFEDYFFTALPHRKQCIITENVPRK